jgi:outer membrane immunogenic protein
MRQALIAIIGFAVLISTPTLAADIATKAPPKPVAAPHTWTGWYVGVTAGYGFGNTSQSLSNDAGEANVGPPSTHPLPSGLHPDGFVGGVEAGYNYQTGSFLAGLDADFSYSGLRQTASAIGPPFIGGTLQTTVTTKLDWFGTVRGRLGVLPTNNLLLYGTGGFAYGDVQTSTIGVNVAAPPCNGPGGFIYCASGKTSGISVGWTAGAGLQYALSSHWMIKAEYLYIDLGKKSVTYPDLDAPLPGGTFTSTTNFTANIVRVGADYAF